MAQSNSSSSITRPAETLPSRRIERSLNSPWEGLADMHRQMDDFFSRAFGFTPLSTIIPSDQFDMPEIDIYEKDDKVIAKAAVPGFTPDEINVEATADSIQIRGEKKAESFDEKTRYHRQSRWSTFSKFTATLPLPTEIDPSKVNAKLEHGMLTVELPKSEQARQRSVKVNVKGT